MNESFCGLIHAKLEPTHAETSAGEDPDIRFKPNMSFTSYFETPIFSKILLVFPIVGPIEDTK